MYTHHTVRCACYCEKSPPCCSRFQWLPFLASVRGVGFHVFSSRILQEFRTMCIVFFLHSVHAFQHFVSFLLRPATQRGVSAGDHAVCGLLTYRRRIHRICGTLLSPTCEEYTARALCSLRSTARRLDCRRSSRYVPRFFGWSLWLSQEGGLQACSGALALSARPSPRSVSRHLQSSFLSHRAGALSLSLEAGHY